MQRAGGEAKRNGPTYCLHCLRISVCHRSGDHRHGEEGSQHYAKLDHKAQFQFTKTGLQVGLDRTKISSERIDLGVQVGLDLAEVSPDCRRPSPAAPLTAPAMASARGSRMPAPRRRWTNSRVSNATRTTVEHPYPFPLVWGLLSAESMKEASPWTEHPLPPIQGGGLTSPKRRPHPPSNRWGGRPAPLLKERIVSFNGWQKR